MNATHHPFRRAASVIAIGVAVGLAGCGPKTPTTVGAAAPMMAQDPARVGQPVPPVQNGYAATAPVYAQAPVQTAQVQQPQYAPQPQQYAQQPYPQQQAYQQPQQQQPQQQYAPPPPQYAQAPAPQPHYAPQPAPRVVASASLGEVEHIEPIRTRPQGSGAGAVIGGVLGAVVGNQFGHGTGKAGMTVLGAAGGAVAGNNVERNHKEGISGYRVSVRMDNGQVRTYEESSLDGLRIGDRVRVSNGRVHRA